MADVLTAWDRWINQIHAHLRDEFILPEQLAEDQRLLLQWTQTTAPTEQEGLIDGQRVQIPAESC